MFPERTVTSKKAISIPTAVLRDYLYFVDQEQFEQSSAEPDAQVPKSGFES